MRIHGMDHGLPYLTTLYPSTQGYIITPQRRLPDDPHIPDFVIEVVKLSTLPLTFRNVLIVKIKNSQLLEVRHSA